jgi:hypothetical protein
MAVCQSLQILSALRAIVAHCNYESLHVAHSLCRKIRYVSKLSGQQQHKEIQTSGTHNTLSQTIAEMKNTGPLKRKPRAKAEVSSSCQGAREASRDTATFYSLWYDMTQATPAARSSQKQFHYKVK